MSKKLDPEIVKQHNAERHKKWRLANPQRVRDNYKRWYYRHHEEYLDREREKRSNKSERTQRAERNSHYKRRYGITIDGYESLLAIQGGRCGICGSDKAGKQGQHFAVDHDHNTGAVRGLLCIKCNAYLGWFEDRLSWYRHHKGSIESYLLNHNSTTK